MSNQPNQVHIQAECMDPHVALQQSMLPSSSSHDQHAADSNPLALHTYTTAVSSDQETSLAEAIEEGMTTVKNSTSTSPLDQSSPSVLVAPCACGTACESELNPSFSPLPPPLEPVTGFEFDPASILSVSDCFYCNTRLQFPMNATDVRCPHCLNIMRPVRRFHTNCPSCRQLLQYEPTAATFQCPRCAEQITAPTMDAKFIANMNAFDQYFQSIQWQQLYQQLQSNSSAAFTNITNPLNPSSQSASYSTDETSGKVKKPRNRRACKSEYELTHKPPTRPISAKQLFSKENRKAFKSSYPNLGHKEINNLLHQAFELLPIQQKHEFETRVQAMRQEYDTQVANYEAAKLVYEQSEAKETHAATVTSEAETPQSVTKTTQLFLPLVSATLPLPSKMAANATAESLNQ